MFTIGYEGRDVDEFVSCLMQYKVTRLIDVREIPLSRKKGFSKSCKGISNSLSLPSIFRENNRDNLCSESLLQQCYCCYLCSFISSNSLKMSGLLINPSKRFAKNKFKSK